MQNLTLEERERLAYVNGDTATAALLAEAADAVADCEEALETIADMQDRIDILEADE